MTVDGIPVAWRERQSCQRSTLAAPGLRKMKLNGRGRGSRFGYEWMAKADKIVPNTRACQWGSAGVGMTGFSTSRIFAPIAFGLSVTTGVLAQVAPPELKPALE